MKISKRIQILLLSVLMCFVFASPSFSAMSTQCTSDDLCDLITVYKTAPGTKLSGPLTMYFVKTTGDYADMHVFLRLRKGYDLYSFSTIVRNLIYDADEIPGLQDAIEDFIEFNVIPEIYDGATPPHAIKSVDQVIQDYPLCSYCPKPPADEHMNFVIMDIVIAVQD